MCSSDLSHAVIIPLWRVKWMVYFSNAQALMAFTLLTKIFGSRNDRLLKQYRKTVERINALEPALEPLSDEALRQKTEEFKSRLGQGASLDDLLPEAFAVVREASKRVMKMRHFDVQLIGGMALHQGKIAEMRTGEGKTLTATLAVYLNALTGQGVHVVTVNDYLAQRDAQWMGRLYHFLGLSVGINLPQMTREDKQAAYRSDITYGTNNEYGFDYLRDNMVYDAADRVQRGLSYAIVDEVDSILIDEARTPLIISGQAEDHTALYVAMNNIVPSLTRQEGEADPRTGEGVITPGDFTVDEKSHQVYLTEQGHEHAEKLLYQAGLLSDDRPPDAYASIGAPGLKRGAAGEFFFSERGCDVERRNLRDRAATFGEERREIDAVEACLLVGGHGHSPDERRSR